MPTNPHSSPVRRAWFWLAVWIAVIAAESFVGSSENTGRILEPLLTWIFGPLPFLTFFKIHYWIRKVGHFSGYGILGLVAFRAWWTTFASRRLSNHPLSWRSMLSRFHLRAAALAVLVVVAVAGMDEFHQAFEPGRGSSIHDVILDTMGGILAQLALLEISEWRREALYLKLRRAAASSAAPAAESPR